MTRQLAVHDLLHGYHCDDAREEEFRGRMLSLAESARDPFDRSSYAPGHFTASAFILSPDSSALLLIYHGKLHRWLQPGGHVDDDDANILAAARREVREEAAIEQLDVVQAPFDLDIHPIPARKSEPPHEHFDIRFLFRAHDNACAAGDDARDVRWVDLTAIHEVESDDSVMRAVRKLDAHLGRV